MDSKALSDEVTAFIRDRLGLRPSAEEVEIATLDAAALTDLPIRPDFVLGDGGILYIVGVRSSAATIDTVARMVLLGELWRKRQPDFRNVRLVIAAKWFHRREEDLANELGILLVRLPWTLAPPPAREHQAASTRITSEKSWRIVSRLLKEKSSSIRQLALRENVSYGWAHKVVGMLIEQNVVHREDHYVRIADLAGLLSGIAWERPLKNLQIGEGFSTQFEGAFTAAQQMTAIAKDEQIRCAFTSYTAGGLYTGYAVRQDAVYLYLEKEAAGQFRDQFGDGTKNGVRAYLYAPDRDVFANAREIEAVAVTSPAVTLLDLAGLGYSAMDLAKAMAEEYADL